jgi:TPR repeat protein
MRYLNGDGVQKDLAAARKWLQAAATNGHTLAPKKLEELKLQEQAKPAAK